MHMPGLVPLIIVLVLAFLLFGRPGRLSGLMEDLGKGIRGFRKGLDDGAKPDAAPPPAQVRDQSSDRTGS
ncbi:MAG: twin-arginine translocase TatA/TatE family subunit [Hyphomonadaceae bacterium]|nr:twin-arginine translocase TatA/TatE family subunit [Hyphomonadaceae bacterium]